MLNRATITSNVKYLFEHLKDFNPEKYLEFLKNNNLDLPDDVQEVVEKMYYEILLGNEKISIEKQIEIASNNYQLFKEYIKENNIEDRGINARLMLMDIEIPIMTKFVTGRENVRLIRKGYK